MAYDDVIRAMGEFGPHQRRICLLLCLPVITCGIHSMIGVFLSAKPNFRCLLPNESPENATYQLPPNIANTTFPWDFNTKNWSRCERYDADFADPYNVSREDLSLTTATIKCDSFVYDKTTYELTTTTEFDVVCDNAWLGATADSLLLVGMMLGAMIFGGSADRYGRKPTICLALLIQIISELLVAVSPEIISYMIFRLAVGSTIHGIFLISYVSVVEMVVPERRLMVGVCVNLFFALGHVLTAAFAYFITNWRLLQIAAALPNLAFLVYWWLIPESPRWLTTTGRLEEAKAILQKASLENGVELSRDRLDSMLSDCSVKKSDVQKRSVLDLFRYPNLRRKSLLLFLNWFASSATYYGISWNTSSLAGNDYINYLISSLVEIPAGIFVFLTLNRWGRRNVLCATMMLAGICLLLIFIVADDIPWLEVVLAMIGKWAITSAFSAVYVFSAEQFPTVIRNIGTGACSTCGMMGGILSSYINYSSVIWKPLPVIIFGSCSLTAGLSALLLSETLNKKLPETIEDGEQSERGVAKMDETSHF